MGEYQRQERFMVRYVSVPSEEDSVDHDQFVFQHYNGFLQSPHSTFPPHVADVCRLCVIGLAEGHPVRRTAKATF